MNWKWFLFSFEGRINRKPFWLFNLVVFALFVMMKLVVDGEINFKENTVSRVFTLLILWPALATQAKRWHDRNKSGWWLLINIVPLIGAIWTLFEIGLLEGTQGENRFGKDPIEGVGKRYALKRQLTTKEVTWAAGAFILLLLTLFGWLVSQVFISANK